MMAQDWLLGTQWDKEREFADALTNGTTDAQRIDKLERELAEARRVLYLIGAGKAGAKLARETHARPHSAGE